MVKDGTPKNGTQINIQIPSGYLTLPWKSPILIGKPSINGPFSIAMLNNLGYMMKYDEELLSGDTLFLDHSCGWPPAKNLSSFQVISCCF